MKNEKIKALLIDGYLDEPSCLGVPPYISPHIRYTYGALLDSGLRKENIEYRTIDQLRQDWEQNIHWMEEQDLIIIIAGTTVPGNYLGGQPISIKELKELGDKLHYPNRVLGGPITLVRDDFPNYDHLCREIAALDLYQVLTNNKINKDDIVNKISQWAIKGASLTKLHPNYPHLVCEVETFRGCPRSTGHCSFCSERLKQRTYHRQTDHILGEVKELAKYGNHHYRLGCQTNLLLYQAQKTNKNILRPNPAEIEKLYNGIHKNDPELKTLHMDNINPEDIIRWENESRSILETISHYNTPGDIAAFGLESADPVVIEKNNIGADPEKTYRAVEIMNEIGGKRENDIPKLLPGINFLHGLIGEREETMNYNYRFLKKIYQNGLMLRRINIRQVVTLEDYPQISIDKDKFRQYKQKINEEINKPMLERVFPTGTILRNVRTEKRKGKLTYGRQLGTYPILVGIPGQHQLDTFLDVKVIDHGYRSLTALPWPYDIKNASPDELTFIPGIGRSTANQIFLERPETKQELAAIVGKELAGLFY